MIELIIRALKALRISVWQITETAREGAELYFIRQKEDIRRAKDVREASVTVYRDFDFEGKPMRGASSVLVQPGMTFEDVTEKLTIAFEAAKYVNNPFFELPEPETARVKPEGELLALAPEKAADIMAEALFTPDRDDDAFINSAEIYAARTRVRTLSSRGADVQYEIGRVSGEFVVQCESPEDVEMYHDFTYSAPDTLALSGLAADALSTVRDRARAKDAPKAGEYDLILTRKHVKTILDAYLEKADAGMIYAKYSPYHVGLDVQGENISGEKLNISVYPNEPYSPDGVKMIERTLIENGRLMCVVGGTRFCRYLGIAPTGGYENLRVNNGTVSFEEMKQKPYLMPVAFSDFQMDAMRGRFGGEIRLAYLFDGETVRVVTGGSVSGSLLEKHANLTFSTERYVDSSFDGPFAMRIPGVSVAGA